MIKNNFSMPKATKYNSTRVKVAGLDGFDSQAECRRYYELQMLVKAKLITDLTRQVCFELAPACKIHGKTKRALMYYADFTYMEKGVKVIEDVKGVKTKEYIIKRHLMKTIHGIDIKETSA